MKPMLKDRNDGTDHLDDEKMLELLDSEADLNTPSPEGQHVRKCSSCRKRWKELAGTVIALKGRALETPPEWLMTWSEDLPRSNPHRAPSVARKLRLTFDSWRLQPAGARSTLAPASRRMVFHSGSVDIDIEIELAAGGKRSQIRGQVLDAAFPGGRLFAGGEVRLMKNRGLVAGAALDERGEFAFNGIATGVYSLRILARGFHCLIPRLEI